MTTNRRNDLQHCSLSSTHCYSHFIPFLFLLLFTFCFCSSFLSSPLFVSPLFSSLVLSSPPPSVYPIWLSCLSWELSQGTRQFLLNIMALSSAFAIPATCGAKQKKKKKTLQAFAIKPKVFWRNCLLGSA